jgi:transposase
MCHVGIDCSKDQLDWAAVAAANREVVHEGHQPNTAKGIRTLVMQLQHRSPAIVVLEATGSYHVPLLAGLVAAALPVAVVNPAQIKAYRQSQLGRTKTDRQDARLLARFGLARIDELRLYAPPTPRQQQLRAWMSYRDSLIAERTRLAGRREANTFQGDAQVRRWLDEQQQEVKQRLAEVDAAITELLATLPEAPVLREIPGVGPLVTAAVLGYLPVGVWGDAKAAASFAGVIPQLEHSGRRQRSWLSKHGHARVRRYLYMAARSAVRHDPKMKEYYEGLKARGKPEKVALCAAMHKLLRHMMGRLKAWYRTQPAVTMD